MGVERSQPNASRHFDFRLRSDTGDAMWSAMASIAGRITFRTGYLTYSSLNGHAYFAEVPIFLNICDASNKAFATNGIRR